MLNSNFTNSEQKVPRKGKWVGICQFDCLHMATGSHPVSKKKTYLGLHRKSIMLAAAVA